MSVNPKALLAACSFAVLLLTACKEGGTDAVARRRAERFGTTAPAAQVATAIPTSVPTVEPEPIAAQQVAGSVSGAAGLDEATQFLIAAIAVGVGIPALWIVNGLLRLGGLK